MKREAVPEQQQQAPDDASEHADRPERNGPQRKRFERTSRCCGGNRLMTASTFICVSMKEITPIELHRPPIIPINHKSHGRPGVFVPGAPDMVSSSVVFQCASDCRDPIVRHSDTAPPSPSKLDLRPAKHDACLWTTTWSSWGTIGRGPSSGWRSSDDNCTGSHRAAACRLERWELERTAAS